MFQRLSRIEVRVVSGAAGQHTAPLCVVYSASRYTDCGHSGIAGQHSSFTPLPVLLLYSAV